MNKKKSFFNKLNVLVVLLLVMVTAAAYAADLRPVADEVIGSGGVSWVPKVNYAQLVLTISRPDGTVFRKTFESGSSPYVDLSSIFADSYLDGSYIYELRVIPDVQRRVRYEEKDKLSSREAGRQNSLYGAELTQTGAFLVQGGAIVTNNMTEPQLSPEISSGQEGLSGTTDVVYADDLIVQGSACIGIDCVNGESFSFDTIRLKENNLRIKFDDTSALAGFPYVDWQLTANDSASGGANKFSIDDVTNSRTPFTVIAGAPNNALFVSSSGRVGFGTSTPVLDLHKVSGNTPGLRLDQDGSSGFSPQTWDIAGNETNFFVRDVTGGSKLPLRIRPGAPTSSIDIASNGNVGLGTASPDYTFEVERTGAGALMVATRTDGAQMEFSASGSFGIAGTRTNHPVKLRVNLTDVMQLNATGNYIQMLQGGGYYDGNWVNGSSRELKENIKNLTTDDAVEALDGLNPVRYNYKNNKEEEHVGFIAEDVPELVAMKNRDGLTSMDIVAVLTKVVQEQRKAISRLEERIAQLEKNSK